MKNWGSSYRFTAIPLLFFCFSISGTVNLPTLHGQESSRREAEVIKKIEEAGGNVMQISSADESREVSFYLAGKKITDQHLKEIGVVQNVKWLNLANTAVTDEGLKQIAGLDLQKLHLEKTGIGDAALMQLKEMKNLEYLNLYATSVTDKGMKHLNGLTKLKKVYVWQSKVTEAGMKALEEQIPGVEVIGESKLPVFVEKKEEKKMEKKPAAKPVSKEEQLATREKVLKQKEKSLNLKEAALKKREAELKKKEQELQKLSDDKKE